MKDIVEFYDKTSEETTTKVSTTDFSLKPTQTMNNLKQFKEKLRTTRQLLKRYWKSENTKSSIHCNKS